jgi:hypothetical protein
MRLIMARCGDVLTEADLAKLGDAAPDKGVEVLEAMEARMIALERRFRHPVDRGVKGERRKNRRRMFPFRGGYGGNGRAAGARGVI